MTPEELRELIIAITGLVTAIGAVVAALYRIHQRLDDHADAITSIQLNAAAHHPDEPPVT